VGVRHRLVESNELEIPGFSANPPDRCYHCKKELFGILSGIAREEGYAAVCDGSNADDAGDFRPGRRAAREHSVRSPLQDCGLSKDAIRRLSRMFGLPTADRGSFACLSSRFPYGTTIDGESLRRSRRARRYAGVRVPPVPRARPRRGGPHRGRGGRDPSPLRAGGCRRGPLRFRENGFLYVSVDLKGYRTGSMNEALPPSARGLVDGPLKTCNKFIACSVCKTTNS